MDFIKDVNYSKNITVKDLIEQYDNSGLQASNLKKAAEIIVKMKKSGAKIYLTFTSNMASSGLRGIFAQTIEKGLADIVITTTGAIEEDIMKALKEKFILGSFNADDVELHEKGINRIGNIYVTNQSYEKFEAYMQKFLNEIYKKQKVWKTPDFLKELGLTLNDKNSFLYQAAKNNIPIYNPAITDGSLGFQFFLFKNKYSDFQIDVINDFKDLVFQVTRDDQKGIIALGGGVSKHYAILSSTISGGMDYAVYITTARAESGSASGSTTNEAKSWGKIKSNSDAVTVNGDASIIYPLIFTYVCDKLNL